MLTLILISLLIILSQSIIHDLTKQTFSQVYEITIHQYLTTNTHLNHNHLTLFYSSISQNSLSTLELFQNTIMSLSTNKDNQQHQGKEILVKFSYVDCDDDENKIICEYFNIDTLPSITYQQKNRKLYIYIGDINHEQLKDLITKLQNNTPFQSSQSFKQHSIKTSSIWSTITKIMNNQIVKYILIFFVAPFLFGYLVMAKNSTNSKGEVRIQKCQKLFKEQKNVDDGENKKKE